MSEIAAVTMRAARVSCLRCTQIGRISGLVTVVWLTDLVFSRLALETDSSARDDGFVQCAADLEFINRTHATEPSGSAFHSQTVAPLPDRGFNSRNKKMTQRCTCLPPGQGTKRQGCELLAPAIPRNPMPAAQQITIPATVEETQREPQRQFHWVRRLTVPDRSVHWPLRAESEAFQTNKLKFVDTRAFRSSEKSVRPLTN
jgi:hypothetical protein